jgi:hypothetical protein
MVKKSLWGIVWGRFVAETNKGVKSLLNPLILNGGRSGARTQDLWLRRPTLYPTELIARSYTVTVTITTSHMNNQCYSEMVTFFCVGRESSRTI